MSERSLSVLIKIESDIRQHSLLNDADTVIKAAALLTSVGRSFRENIRHDTVVISIAAFHVKANKSENQCTNY